MDEKQTWICDRCGVELELIEAHLKYLDRQFRHKIPRSPRCGLFCIPEDLARGRIREVEKALEDK